MNNLIAAIALEGMYQLTRARTHVRWTRRQFFAKAQGVVARMRARGEIQ